MNDLKDRAPPELGARVATANRVLAAFELRDEIDRIISPRLDDLRGTIARLRPWRGFSAGRWVLGAHTLPDHGTPLPSDYSRIDFEVALESRVPSVVVDCRTTVRGRDRVCRSITTGSDAEGLRQLAAWIETSLLDFAAAWYGLARAELAPLASPEPA